MAELEEQITRARKAEIPDDEIFDFLSSQADLAGKMNQAVQQGISKEEVLNFLGRTKDTIFDVSKAGIQILQDRIPQIDVTTGVQDLGFRAGLSRADTPEERKLFIKNQVGEGNLLKNSIGQEFISAEGMKQLGLESPSGNPVLVDEVGLSLGDIADFAGQAPETLAAIGAGIGASGLGAPAAIPLVALAAMLGKGVDELIEEAQGLNLQPRSEVSLDVLEAGAFGVAGEGIARVLRPLGRKLLGPSTTRDPVGKSVFEGTESVFSLGGVKQGLQNIPTKFGKQDPFRSTIDPERLAIVEKTLERGIVPDIAQATGGRSLVGRFQGVAERIFGSRNEKENLRRLIEEQKRIQAETTQGLPGGITEEQAGLTLEAGVKRLQKPLERAVEISEREVDDSIKQSINTIKQQTGPSGGTAGQTVKDTISNAKSAFSEEASRLYSEVDNLVGNTKVVPTSNLKGVARGILAKFPSTTEGGKAFITPETRTFLQQIIDLEPRISFAQAQNIRTVLTDAAFDENLLSTVGRRNAGLLKQGAQGSIDSAFLGNSFEARKALAVATQFYARNIGKFDNVLVAKLTKEIGARGSVEPSRVVAALTENIPVEQAAKLRRLVGKDVWAQVKREKLDDMLLESEDLVSGQINPTILARQIKKMKGSFNTIFDKEASGIKQLAKQLAAKDGKIDPAILESSGAKVALEKALSDKVALDKFMDKNFIRELQKGGRSFEDAVDYLIHPRRTKQLQEVVRTFGKDSPEVNHLVQASTRKILTNMTARGKDPLDFVLKGKEFLEEIERLGPAIKSLPGGQQRFAALKELGEVTSLVSFKQPFFGGLVAASISLHPTKNIPILAKLLMMGNYLSTPTAVRQFTKGLKANTVRKFSDFSARAMAQSTGFEIQRQVQLLDISLFDIFDEDFSFTPEAVNQ